MVHDPWLDNDSRHNASQLTKYWKHILLIMVMIHIVNTPRLWAIIIRVLATHSSYVDECDNIRSCAVRLPVENMNILFQEHTESTKTIVLHLNPTMTFLVGCLCKSIKDDVNVSQFSIPNSVPYLFGMIHGIILFVRHKHFTAPPS